MLASRWALGAAARAAFAMAAASHAFCSCAACAAAAAAAGVSEGDRAGDKTSGVNGAGLVASPASYGDDYMQSPVLGSTALTDPTDTQQAGPLDNGHTMLHADLTPAIYGMLQSQQNL